MEPPLFSSSLTHQRKTLTWNATTEPCYLYSEKTTMVPVGSQG